MTGPDISRSRELLRQLFLQSLAEVDGRRCVADFLQARPDSGRTAVVAIGKAAAAMMAGAAETLQENFHAGLVIGPAGVTPEALPCEDRIIRLYGNHPLPGADSLAAGERLLDFIRHLPAGSRILFLISGGTSSLVEVPAKDISLQALQAASTWLLGSGLDIRQMNRVRSALSQIKGGQLVSCLDERPALVLLLSDVPDDDVSVIGSGLLYPVTAPAELPDGLPAWLQKLLVPVPEVAMNRPAIGHHIVGRNRDVQQGIVSRARRLGLPADIRDEVLSGDVLAAASRIVSELRVAEPGLYIWGGETTVCLPENPGRGGRNQQLALAAAMQLNADVPVVLLAAGTDGRDGNSDAAGAVVDADSVRRGAHEGLNAAVHLLRADAGTFLQASGDLFTTGPTGTNVMDIVMGMKLH